jgi:WS/DGAT/MGAT family acyltransferase
MTVDRLTALDTSFLCSEQPGMPMHVGAVATFEAGPLLDGRGRLRLDELQTRVDARLGALPRLRRRLAPVPFGLDRPHWIDDPEFEVTRHVGELCAPPPGDDATLRSLAARVLGETLPRDRPLWDLRFVTGLADDRVALVERVHHSLVDGVSGVDLATVLLDQEPDAAPPLSPPAWWAPPLPTVTAQLADGLWERAGDPVRAARRLADAARHPTRAVRAVRTVGMGLGTLVASGLAPRTSLNREPSGDLQLAWVRAQLDDVRTAGAAAGASVNDVVLTAVAGGLRWLLLERGEALPSDLLLKVLVPVSLRRVDECGTLGNRVGAIYAPLPIGVGDPQARLAAVTDGMRRLKERGDGEATGLLLDAADVLPAGASRLMSRAVEHQRIVNLVVTNVPGPPMPLYAAGARMLDAYPVVPLGANLAVGVAVLSYAGTLAMTLTADSVACPDVDTFAAGIEKALAQLGASPIPVGKTSVTRHRTTAVRAPA